MAETDFPGVTKGDGFAIAHIDDLGDQYGFRKIRKGLGVTAYGMNAIVIPPGFETGRHYHDEQEETYFVHRGNVVMLFGDGSEHELGPGGVAHVDAATVRGFRNGSESEDAVVVVVGGKGGYVGRDGRLPEGDASSGPPGAA
jgi:quercetin dioxygenase-like cupin family protein